MAVIPIQLIRTYSLFHMLIQNLIRRADSLQFKNSLSDFEVANDEVLFLTSSQLLLTKKVYSERR